MCNSQTEALIEGKWYVAKKIQAYTKNKPPLPSKHEVDKTPLSAVSTPFDTQKEAEVALQGYSNDHYFVGRAQRVNGSFRIVEVSKE